MGSKKSTKRSKKPAAKIGDLAVKNTRSVKGGAEPVNGFQLQPGSSRLTAPTVLRNEPVNG